MDKDTVLPERVVIECSVIGARRFLEVCQYLCIKRKRGEAINDIYQDCSVAINQYRCPVVVRLFPKRKDKDEVQVLSVADEGVPEGVRDESEGGDNNPHEPSGMPRRRGRKAKVVPDAESNGDADVLPPLPRKRVPKNGRKDSGRGRTAARRKGNSNRRSSK